MEHGGYSFPNPLQGEKFPSYVNLNFLAERAIHYPQELAFKESNKISLPILSPPYS
jgi:hypothetical protein